MKKIFIVFVLLTCVFSLYAAPVNNQKNETEAIAANTYTFSEELIEIPIKPFVVGKINESDLLNLNPQLLQLYEAAVNAEKQGTALNNPAPVVKAWTEITKIPRQNPFFKTAVTRLAEWKTAIELFNRHQANLDKIKMLIASTLLSDEQKTNIVSQHLEEFGVSFGTKEILDLIGKTAIHGNADFQTKLKETKQKRCEKSSGKDCFDCGKEVSAEYEKLIFFAKACELKYQPGCDEAGKIRAAQDAEKARAAAEAKRKAEEFATKSYNLADDPVDVIKPFVLGTIGENDILNSDPQVLKKFENAVAKEKEKESIKTPGAMTLMWEEIAKISDRNPFRQTAETRSAEWRACAEKMDKYETDLNQMKKNFKENSVAPEEKIKVVLKHLADFGLNFGTSEIQNLSVYNTEITSNPDIKTRIRDIRKQRCTLDSAADCQSFALNHAANEEEKSAYLKKACDLGRQQACGNQIVPGPEQLALPIPGQENAAAENNVEPEKKSEPTEDDLYREELNQAGRKTRLTIATATLVSGVVVGALGGVSFYGMNKAQKDRDKYWDAYNQSVTPDDVNNYRKKTSDADSRRKTYMILGGVGIGVGIALIATGITFYSIEFEGEKEVKKKYNVSFGASPMDGTLQFALNW